MRAISNTGPIIALAKVNHLYLLKELFGEVLIPSMVHRELCAKSGSEWNAIENALKDYLKVKEPSPLEESVRLVLSDIDEGERQAIGLALTIGKEVILLLDDRAGRQSARKLDIPVTGIVGILLLAKERGLINSAVFVLESIRGNGYWLSNKIIEVARQIANE